MRRLATTVTMHDSQGKLRTFAPGTHEDSIPEDLLEQITNPKCWGEPDAVPQEYQHPKRGVIVYEDMTVRQLLDLVKQHKLQTESVRKSDLIAALEEYDAAQQ